MKNGMDDPGKIWDVFISHASEDKESFVRPLAIALKCLGVSVWYDEFSLHLGDSLSRSIDKGLAKSKYGLVIISLDFIRKPWPEYELRGLVSREMQEGRVIIPIWHGVTKAQVIEFSPPLADKVALDTDKVEAQDIAIQILREVRPDLYEQHPRTELERIASGEALRELQSEIEKTRKELEEARQELAQYRCPYCGSALSVRLGAPADPLQKHWADREVFECGFQTFGGALEKPCPHDPMFPKFEDYELLTQQIHKEEDESWWICVAEGKTRMAKLLFLFPGHGRTKEEAESQVREVYDQLARKDRKVSSEKEFFYLHPHQRPHWGGGGK